MTREHILSLSYGKDSLACLAAIEQLGWPIDRIIHAEVWATDEIPADLPPMVGFKAKADAIIKDRWGIEVEHLCAMKNGKKLTYEKLFYHVPKRKPGGKLSEDTVAGYPYQKGAWCQDRLKGNVLDAISTHTHMEAVAGFHFVSGSWCKKLKDGTYRLGGRSWADRGAAAASSGGFSPGSLARGAKKNIVQYLGIAADEPVRIERHQKPGFKMHLVEAGWTEAMCMDWCEKNGLLSPIYTDSARGGAAGSVTTKGSGSFDFCGRITRNYGHC